MIGPFSPSLVDSSGSGGGLASNNPNAMDLSNELWQLQAHGNPDFMPEPPYHHISKEVIGGGGGHQPPPTPSSSVLPPNYHGTNSMAGFDLEVLRGHHQSHLEAAAHAAHQHYAAAAGAGPHYPGTAGHYEMDNNNEMMFIEAATATSVASGDSYHPSSALVTPMEFNMATHEVMIGGGQFEDHVHPHFTS